MNRSMNTENIGGIRATTYDLNKRNQASSRLWIFVENANSRMVFPVPVLPDSIEDNMNSSWSSQTPIGRSGSIYSYTSTSERSINFSLKLHREVFTKEYMDAGIIGAVAGAFSNVTTDVANALKRGGGGIVEWIAELREDLTRVGRNFLGFTDEQRERGDQSLFERMYTTDMAAYNTNASQYNDDEEPSYNLDTLINGLRSALYPSYGMDSKSGYSPTMIMVQYNDFKVRGKLDSVNVTWEKPLVQIKGINKYAIANISLAITDIAEGVLSTADFYNPDKKYSAMNPFAH